METDETGSGGGGENGNGNVDEDNSSVRVALRIRPALPREQIEGCKTCTTVATDGTPQVWIGSNHAFTYDHVFDQNTAQPIIFDDVVKKLVDGCLNGYNATVLAYGQTGSGKTYTMGTGFEIDPCADTQGIIPRAVMYLFMQMENIRRESPELKADFKVEVNFVELYNEEVVDLLGQSGCRPTSASALSRPGSANAAGSGSIRIHEDSNGSIYVVGIRTVQVESCHETLKFLKDGALSRTTASTNMNDTSSRSHAIFTMHVTQKKISTEFGESELETLSAKFHFVDLAGSERLKRTLATGDRQKEGISINCGLLALGNVISALGDRTRKVSHVPYRDSKLTRLLQDSLGGNSRTVMIACVSPSDRDFVETLNTLKYANRARNIKNRITINQDKSSRTIASLRREIELLQSELLEFKQGKRTVSDNYNDTHQENILLITEIETLKSRLKSKQESIDKLTNTVATFETHKEIQAMSGTDCDLTKIVQKYLHEIEDLRTKLYESEQECEKLRLKQRRLNTTLASPRQQVLEEVANHDVIKNAKADILNDKKKLEQLATKSDTDSDSESDSEDQEKFQAIADLTSEIGIKERLIEELERSHNRVELMKKHYEEKIECLNSKIKGTQDQRDQVLSSMKNGKRSAEVNADYDKKLASMQAEVKKLEQAQKAHVKKINSQQQYQKQIENLKSEVENLKQTKVKLLNQSKIESMKFRDMETRRIKEINLLKKDQRVKDIKLKTLENDRIKKDQVLKRKHEEVNNLKKINKLQMSRRAQGRSRNIGGISPVKAKSKWNNVQHEIRKAVSIKTTVSSLENEMMNLIQERTESRRRLKELDSLVNKDEYDMDDIESLKINLSFLEEKLVEIQNQIAEISSGVKEYDGSQFDEVEMHYVFKKMFEMNIGNLSEIERFERRVDDMEETNKVLNKEISSLRTLLQHVYQSKSGQVGDIDDVLNDLPPPSRIPVQQVESNSDTFNKLRKARRLTSTPQELLGSLENVSKVGGFLNPNDVLPGNSFLRGNRMTQSLRVNGSGIKRPQLQRQDTYSVADRDRTFTTSYDPPEKLTEESNRNSGDTFNTTFLVQKSPPSSSSSQRLTYTTDSNNLWDNSINHDGKGCIRRFSNGLKEKDKVMWMSHIAEGHTKPVISMFASKSRLYTGSKDCTSKVYDLHTGKEIASYIGHPSNVQCIHYDEKTQIVFTVSGSFVKLWDTRSNLCTKTLTSSGTATDKAVSNFDGRLLQNGETVIQSIALRRNYLYTTADNRIRVWDLNKLNSSIGILAGKHSSNIMCLATAEDVKLDNSLCDIIVSGSKDHYIKLYVIDPDQTIESIRPSKNLDPPHYDGIESLLIRNTELYSGSRDTCIKKWDLAKAEMKCTASNAHAGWITGLSKLPDNYNSDYILSSSRDGSVKIWDSDLKEIYKVEIGIGSQSNYCVESLCVNEELVFTAGGGSSNSNNMSSSNGNISMWRLDENALLAAKVRSQSECYRYPMSPRLTATRKSNKMRYRSNEDLMTRSIGFELPY